MSYQVFARKYRPSTFDDILGQDHVVRTLKNAINQNRLAHAYLFVGPRGTGKTSTSRIFAKALNCPGGPRVDFDPLDPVCLDIAAGLSFDVMEIDGASNNGVDDVRKLRDNVMYPPMHGKFRIYYIDEVHMLSTQAFNALLKTLEEPPAHAKFIFATTEAHKVLPTILSRCQRFDLRPIPTELIASHLLHIAQLEQIDLEKMAAWAIAKGADGGMRDAQSMLDQLVSFCGEKIREEDVLNIFGFTSRETVAKFCSAILSKNTAGVLELLQQEALTGRDMGQLLHELMNTIRAIVVSRIQSESSSEGIPEEMWRQLLKRAEECCPRGPEPLLAVIEIMADAAKRMKDGTQQKLHMELGLIKSIQALSEVRLSDVIRVLADSAGLFVAGAASAPAQVAGDAVAPPAVPVAMAPVQAPMEKPEVAVLSIEKPTEAAFDEAAVNDAVRQPSAPAQESVTDSFSPSQEVEGGAPRKTLAQMIEEASDEPLPVVNAAQGSPLDRLDSQVPMPSAADLQANAPTRKDKASASSSAASSHEEEENDPLIKKALEIFAGTLRKA